jgi:hypothetical protein
MPSLYSMRSRLVRQQLGSRRRRESRHALELHAAVAGDGHQQTLDPAAEGINGNGMSPAEAAALLSEAAVPPLTEQPLFVSPEDFTLPPGELSTIDRTSPPSTQDVFRCPGCTEPACQVRPLVVWGPKRPVCKRRPPFRKQAVAHWHLQATVVLSKLQVLGQKGPNMGHEIATQQLGLGQKWPNLGHELATPHVFILPRDAQMDHICIYTSLSRLAQL